MNWHTRFFLMSLLTAVLCFADYYTNLPAWRLFAVWAAIIWVGTAIRYIYWLITQDITVNSQLAIINSQLAKAWAVLQTFTFITFTRLFFRSSSNLDPHHPGFPMGVQMGRNDVHRRYGHSLVSL